jgi:hypothetical protein
MTIRSSTRNLAAVCVVPVLAAAGALAPLEFARGQEVRVMNFTGRAGPDGPNAGMISKKSVEKYGKVLGLDADQQQAAGALHDGYASEYQTAQKEFRDAMAELTRSFEESQDHSVFRDKMPVARTKRQERVEKLEATFMADLQALLATEQSARWPAVERQRRRETTLRGGAISGEGVNLIDIVEGLGVPASGDLAQTLDQYESDLDRALVNKQKATEGNQSFDGGRVDIEAFQARMAKMREVGMALRDINQRYARTIEALLPESKQFEFGTSVRKATFPRVYRPSNAARQLDAALKFDDLDASQKQSLAALKETYDREVAGVNERWAAAIEEDEKSGQGGMMAMGDGAMMQIRMGGEDDTSPVAQASKARRELDDRTRDKLNSQLKPAQKERLPKTQDREQVEGEGVFVGGAQMMIHVEEGGPGGGG